MLPVVQYAIVPVAHDMKFVVRTSFVFLAMATVYVYGLNASDPMVPFILMGIVLVIIK